MTFKVVQGCPIQEAPMDLYFLTGSNGPTLCKYRYLLAHELEDHPDRFRAFLGPLAHLHAAQYPDGIFPLLWPLGEVQVNALVVSAEDHRIITMRSPETTGIGCGR
jgi:hypothetical protein